VLRRVFATFAYLIGIAGAGLFMLYVLASGTGFLPGAEVPKEGVYPWLNNLFWLSLFALQHSGMARQSYKKFIVRWIPVSLDRSVYVLMSGVVLTLFTLFWEPLPGDPIWHGPIWLLAISIGGICAVAACSARFDHAAFFGLTYYSGPNSLHIDGPYRYVRHPLMLGLLVAIWAQPIMPRELLMMNAGITVYIMLAIRLEEQDLVRVYGNEYEQYRNAIPALIPFVHLARNRKR
jgi:protein-S-isoprenylcysteine O-methyltransferase Ste14